MKALNLTTGKTHDVDDIDIENNIVILKDDETNELFRQFLHKVTLFGYNRGESRPVEAHKHERGELVVMEHEKNVVLGIKDDSKLGYTPLASFHNKNESTVATAKLFAVADNLIQIAEMYFDSMQTRGEQNSLPFQITLDTLNKYSIKK